LNKTTAFRFSFGLTSQMSHQDIEGCAATKSFLQSLTCRRSFSVSLVIAKLAPKSRHIGFCGQRFRKEFPVLFQCFSRFTIHCFYQSFIHNFQLRQTIVCTFFISRLVIFNLSLAA